jgi:hypothetical protein
MLIVNTPIATISTIFFMFVSLVFNLGFRVRGSGFRENFVANFVASFVDSVILISYYLVCSSSAGGVLVSNLAILSHVCHVEKGRAWVSDPAAARSENVALPFLFAWFALFDAKKLPGGLFPGHFTAYCYCYCAAPGGGLTCNLSVKSWALSVKRSNF